MRNKDFKYFPLVISAPSGGGKSAVRDRLLKKDSRFRFSITCTTRKKRKGEINGRDYFFVSESGFKSLIKSGKLLEWAKVHGNYYGTPARSVERILDKGFIPVMTIDVKGAASVRKRFPHAVTVFLLPPGLNALEARLKKRGESIESVKVRIATAMKEIERSYEFDYAVINDKLENAVKDIIGIVSAESMKVERNAGCIYEFKKQLQR
ncbi:MAG: guanylate kinase [Elusimicrobia bacterium]|nr:guanylate kinase [Elusimicrobiota bacterium]